MHVLILVCSFIAVGFLSPLEGFLPKHHGGLIRQAFDAVDEASNLASVDSAVEESTELDRREANEAEEYKHSMRPASQGLAEARAKADEYWQTFMATAVSSALRGDRRAAGQALGRLLHLVQDRKHNWCSCGRDSNPRDSHDACAAQGGACSAPGLGNHAMTWCSLVLEASPFNHFQLKTDLHPTDPQMHQALKDSIDVLGQFIRSVQAEQKR